MSNDLKSKLSIDTKPFIGGLKKATGSVKVWATKVKASTKKAAAGFKSVAGAVIKVVKAVAAIAAAPLVAFNSVVHQLAENLDKVGKVASNLDIDTGFFQALQVKAKLSGLEVSNLDQIFRRTLRSADSAREGTGRTADAYAKLGVKVTKANGELKDTDQLFLEVADGLDKIESASERAAISMLIFGRNGADMGVLIAGGADELLRFQQAAEDMDIIIPESLIRRVEELNDRFTILQKVTEKTASKGAESALKLKLRWEEAKNVMVGWGATITNVMSAAVESFVYLKDRWLENFHLIDTAFLRSQRAALEWMNGIWETETVTQKIADVTKLIKESDEAYQAAANTRYAKNKKEEESVKALIEVEKKRKEAATNPTSTSTSSVATPFVGPRIDKTLLQQRAAAQQLADSLKPATEQLQLQYAKQLEILQTMDEGTAKQEALTALAEKHSEAMLKVQNSEAMEKWKEQYGDLALLAEDFSEQLGSALVDSLDQGSEAFDKFAQNFLKQVAKMIVKALILQAIQAATGMPVAGSGGGFSSILGGISGKKFGGGHVIPNRDYLVGDKGPEILRTGSGGGRITPNNQMVGDVIVNVENSGSAKNVDASFDSKNNIINIVMDDLNAGGPLSRVIRTKR